MARNAFCQRELREDMSCCLINSSTASLKEYSTQVQTTCLCSLSSLAMSSISARGGFRSISPLLGNRVEVDCWRFNLNQCVVFKYSWELAFCVVSKRSHPRKVVSFTMVLSPSSTFATSY